MADYIALALILAVALYLFWQHKLQTDVTALLVTLALILPWPHPDGQWRSILTYQEGFLGFGSVAVVMVVSMFVFGGAIVRTGAAEFLGTRRWCLRRVRRPSFSTDENFCRPRAQGSLRRRNWRASI